MARRAEPIHCDSSDIKALYTIINNPESNADLVTRARIILMANDGKDSKTIAKTLDIRENTVGDWRKRYLNGGIAELRDRPRPGRRGNQGRNARAEVAEAYDENHPVKNVRELSEQFNTSVDTVRRGLKDAGIQTGSLHSISSYLKSSSKTVDIEGMYIGADAKALVLRLSPKAETVMGNGEIITRADIFSESAEPLPLHEILNRISSTVGITGYKGLSVYEFISGLLNRNSTADIQHAVIMNGHRGSFTSAATPTNVYFTEVSDTDMWLREVYVWMMMLCDDDTGFETVESIRSYIEKRKEREEPFMWSCREIEQGEKEMADGDTVLTIHAVIRNRSGEISDCTMNFKNVVPPLSEAEYTDKYTLATYVGKAEAGIREGMTQTARILLEDYMEDAFKKNRIRK